MYEDNASGKIPDKHFSRMLSEYDREQSNLEQEVLVLEKAISTQTHDYNSPQKFVDLVRRYTSFSELTTPMLNEFVEKIIVHEATGGRSNRQQKVDIYFNFIGEFVPPPQIVQTPAVSTSNSQPAIKNPSASYC